MNPIINPIDLNLYIGARYLGRITLPDTGIIKLVKYLKSKGKCRGCNRRKLINLMRLCKRCNKEAHKYLTKEEMEQILMEQASFAASAKAAKDEEKAREADEEEKGGEKEGDEEKKTDSKDED